MTKLLGRRDDASGANHAPVPQAGQLVGTTPGGRSALAWQRAVTSALRPLELTHVQFVLLGTVWWLVEPARSPEQLSSQRQIATHAGADVVMTSHVVRTLEHRGLLARIADPADARVRRLLMTCTAACWRSEPYRWLEGADAAFFAEVGDQQQLLDVLRQLARPVPASTTTSPAVPAPVPG